MSPVSVASTRASPPPSWPVNTLPCDTTVQSLPSLDVHTVGCSLPVSRVPTATSPGPPSATSLMDSYCGVTRDWLVDRVQVFPSLEVHTAASVALLAPGLV